MHSVPLSSRAKYRKRPSAREERAPAGVVELADPARLARRRRPSGRSASCRRDTTGRRAGRRRATRRTAGSPRPPPARRRAVRSDRSAARPLLSAPCGSTIDAAESTACLRACLRPRAAPARLARRRLGSHPATTPPSRGRDSTRGPMRGGAGAARVSSATTGGALRSRAGRSGRHEAPPPPSPGGPAARRGGPPAVSGPPQPVAARTRSTGVRRRSHYRSSLLMRPPVDPARSPHCAWTRRVCPTPSSSLPSNRPWPRRGGLWDNRRYRPRGGLATEVTADAALTPGAHGGRAGPGARTHARGAVAPRRARRHGARAPAARRGRRRRRRGDAHRALPARARRRGPAPRAEAVLARRPARRVGAPAERRSTSRCSPTAARRR